MLIGSPSDNYAYKRNINDMIDNVTYCRVYDFYRIINFVPKAINRKLTRRFLPGLVCDFDFSFNDFNLHQRVDVLHFFNSISYAKRPWITTFETVVPRFMQILEWLRSPDRIDAPTKGDQRINKALRTMAGPSCKNLIAMSQNAFSIQNKLLGLFPEYREIVLKKMRVLHPPQESLVPSYKGKKLVDGDPIRFVFIGHDFFRKGGCEILSVFERFRRQAEIELIIVSALRGNDYISGKNKNDVKQISDYINRNSDWITFYRKLPYSDVLRLIRRCHVGLLPTWADTYGYSVLEFQAAACPVISTDIRALPEINNSNVGWMVEVPKIYSGDIDITYGRRFVKECIEEGLASALEAILDDPASVAKKGQMALNRIKTHHSPNRYSEAFKGIYAQALS